MLLDILDIAFPLTNPVLKFLVILLIILLAPLLLNTLKIPHLLGLIVAGAIVGPYGLNLMERDSGIILSGTAGLLYIMFLAGLEIDLTDFKKSFKKSVTFGLYTFAIPMTLGILAGLYLLHFSVLSSVLLASMFASHTLIAYPLISKLGVVKNQAVTITVGGTMITDTLSLLVLAVVVGMTTGEVSLPFWLKLAASLVAFGLFITLVFPLIARWFFKRYDDNVSQYIFVLVMVFWGAALAELAGIEAIIGAFLAGLSLNRLIPRVSPLMNRIEFVGNAIFIPFFLIGVGMLIDYQAFFKDTETITVALVMTVVAMAAKYAAAWLTQATYRFSVDERRLIFGLSNAQAAATLAAVLVGYNIILGQTATGEDIRLLNESVLNGTILMILVTCTVASFVAQKGAKNLVLSEMAAPEVDEEYQERILIPVSNNNTSDELINLSVTMKSPRQTNGLYALHVVDNRSTDSAADRKAHQILHNAAVAASATDNHLHPLLRYDINIINGVAGAVKENKITDLVLGLHEKAGMSDSFFGNLTEGILSKCNTTTLIFKATQPLATIKRYLVVIPPQAEKEIGFAFWLIKVWNIARNTGAKLIFYAHAETLKYLLRVQQEHPVLSEQVVFADWNDFLILSREVQKNDSLIIVMSRKGRPSYHPLMSKIPTFLDQYFQASSFILLYPKQNGVDETSAIDLTNPSILEPIEKLDEIGKTLATLLRRK